MIRVTRIVAVPIVVIIMCLAVTNPTWAQNRGAEIADDYSSAFRRLLCGANSSIRPCLQSLRVMAIRVPQV